MKEIVYALAMFVFAVSLLTFVLGVLQPSLFKFRILGLKLDRRLVALCSICLLVLSMVVASTFEPARIQQARTEQEKNSETSEHVKKAEEAQVQPELKVPEPDPDKSDRIDLGKPPEYRGPATQNSPATPSLTHVNLHRSPAENANEKCTKVYKRNGHKSCETRLIDGQQQSRN